MSYSPSLGSAFNRTKMRDSGHICTPSGMCVMCTADCTGSCEIGLSAVRGKDTVYPQYHGGKPDCGREDAPHRLFPF